MAMLVLLVAGAFIRELRATVLLQVNFQKQSQRAKVENVFQTLQSLYSCTGM